MPTVAFTFQDNPYEMGVTDGAAWFKAGNSLVGTDPVSMLPAGQVSGGAAKVDVVQSVSAECANSLVELGEWCWAKLYRRGFIVGWVVASERGSGAGAGAPASA